jgi:alkylresorcinol/alkylpyrone synthase
LACVIFVLGRALALVAADVLNYMVRRRRRRRRRAQREESDFPLAAGAVAAPVRCAWHATKAVPACSFDLDHALDNNMVLSTSTRHRRRDGRESLMTQRRKLVTAALTGASHALPAPMDQQRLWDGFFRDHYADARLARKVWEHSAITTRRGVVDPTQEDISSWGTAARMQRFLAEAMPLGKEAVGGALAEAGLEPTDVGLFTVVSCTGYVTPGLDILLARDLGMTDAVQRLHIGHMGCYAALPGLGATADYVTARQKPAVMLCLELTSLHVQPTTKTARSGSPTPEDLQQMVAHALFSDAAAAVVLEPTTPGLEVVDVVARTDVATADHMTWDVTDLGFKMGLSPAVPDVLARHARAVVEELLAAHGMSVADVDGWAIHPGGRKIVDVVGEVLGVTEEQLVPSYDVLRDVGNCSSATVLLVLERLAQTVDVPAGGTFVAMAFGPG